MCAPADPLDSKAVPWLQYFACRPLVQVFGQKLQKAL